MKRHLLFPETRKEFVLCSGTTSWPTKSKRINPKGGGGGGADPGGGGGGTTTDSALSLVGKGANEKEVRETPGAAQATGETGAILPEEFRAGLDTYFNR